jgi:predicted acyltransferase
MNEEPKKEESKNEEPKKIERLMSLDALRGADMLFIMGFASWIVVLCALLPKCGLTEWISTQMSHVNWHGLRHHDTIFPLFLFMAGVSFPFSLAKQQEQGRAPWRIYLKIVIRGLLLVLLGLIYNGMLQFEFPKLRYASVLARIGLAWMFAALLFTRIRKTSILASIAAVILIGYWLAMWLIPGGDDPFSYENNLVGTIDRFFFSADHLYNKTFDPEGLFSTIPAIVTAMLGMFAGQLVRSTKISGNKKALYLLLAGVAFALIGWLWGMVFPINKKLWTSTFVCAVGGYSLICFAIFYYIIDVKGWRRWSFFFRVIGMNSITIYMMQRIVDCSRINRFFFGGIIKWFDGDWNKLAWHTFYILTCWLILFFFYKKKIFLKV